MGNSKQVFSSVAFCVFVVVFNSTVFADGHVQSILQKLQSIPHIHTTVQQTQEQPGLQLQANKAVREAAVIVATFLAQLDTREEKKAAYTEILRALRPDTVVYQHVKSIKNVLIP